MVSSRVDGRPTGNTNSEVLVTPLLPAPVWMDASPAIPERHRWGSDRLQRFAILPPL